MRMGFTTTHHGMGLASLMTVLTVGVLGAGG